MNNLLRKLITRFKKSKPTLQKNLYQCPECGFHYQDAAWAKECEAWCRGHKSCNIEITAYAEENKKSGT